MDEVDESNQELDDAELEEIAELEADDHEADTETREQVLVVDTGGIVKVVSLVAIKLTGESGCPPSKASR